MSRLVEDVEERVAGIATGVRHVRARVADAARAAGRDPAEVTLVAVGKTHAPALLGAALDAGVTDLGENRVEELVAKRHALADHPGPVRWHMVGRLRTRAANQALDRDVLVHSLDRRRLVDRFERLGAEHDVVQPVLVQVNVGDDPAKGGCGLHEVDELVAYAREQPHLTVEGLMTVPPMPPDGTAAGAAARPHFARLRELRDRLGLEQLSMGMSADLEAAVAEGATLVRVGTAVFGARGDAPWEPVAGGPHAL